MTFIILYIFFFILFCKYILRKSNIKYNNLNMDQDILLTCHACCSLVSFQFSLYFLIEVDLFISFPTWNLHLKTKFNVQRNWKKKFLHIVLLIYKDNKSNFVIIRIFVIYAAVECRNVSNIFLWIYSHRSKERKIRK